MKSHPAGDTEKGKKEMKCYNYDGIKTMLEKELSKEKTLLAAWEKVSFPTKKDGTPFANMSKNFDGAKYQTERYANNQWECQLAVYAWDEMNGYIDDYFRCSEMVSELNEKKKAKTENYLPKVACYSQMYMYDIEDIKEAVTARIERHKKRIVSLEHQIAISQEVFTAFKTAYGDAVKALENACGNDETYGTGNDLYYAVLDTVKERYPYC